MEEINIKVTEKEIDYQISVKNNFWNATVLSFGGTLGLLFIQNSYLKLIFIIIGFFFSMVFMKSYLYRYELIRYLINNLKKMR